ncbi:MAG: phosphotransferase [Planctomycetota bacterium]
MDGFSTLTNTGQARRIRGLAGPVLRAFGLPEPGAGVSLRLIHHWQNTTFVVEVASERGAYRLTDAWVPGRYLLRVSRPVERTLAHVSGEMAWLAALREDTGLVVPEPVLTVAGEPALLFGDGAGWAGVGGARVWSLMRWVPGRMVGPKSRRPVHLERLGRAMAEMHRHTTSWRGAARLDRPPWGPSGMLGRDASLGIEPDVWEDLPADELALHTRCEARLLAMWDALGEGPEAYGLLHADLHLRNVVFAGGAGGAARPIDFDDCGFGHHAYDLACTLLGFEREPWWEAFLQGYRSVRELPEQTLAAVDVYLAVRMTTLLLWYRSSARTNPVFAKFLEGTRKRFLPEIRRLLRAG